MTASVAPMRGSNFQSRNIIPKGYKYGRIAQFTPEQQSLFNDLIQQTQGGSFLSRLSQGDQSMFEQLEAPAMRQFSQLQGTIANRFNRGSGAGSFGSLGSSGMKNFQNQAAADLAQQLQSQRLGLQQDALKQLLDLSTSLLSQKPYEQFLVEKQQRDNGGLWKGLIGGAAPLAGAAIGGYLGGMPGAALGSKLGGDFTKGLYGK